MSDEWTFPADVRGWLSEPEGRLLADLARGKRVLEIGCFEGRSTICMAQTAVRVDVIDPMDGRATPTPGSTTEAFQENMRRYRCGARLFVGTTQEIAPDLEPGYDLVFIDGDHSLAAVREDVRHAWRLLAPGGMIAFHDFESAAHPDVTQVVHELLAKGAEAVARSEMVACVRPPAARPTVLLAMPRGGELVHFRASRGYWYAPTFGKCRVMLMDAMSSMLDFSMNSCWAAGLRLRGQGVQFLALQHSDVQPDPGWLDVLLGELLVTGADVISAVVPIKHTDGTTSTGIETADIWNPRRLTMAEVHDLPETFSDQDVGGELLLNTGLWLCRLDRPWCDTPEPPHFQTVSRLHRNAEGEWAAQVRSEDWEFSRELRRRGAKQVVTRKVGLDHGGFKDFTNREVWGTCQTDPKYKPEGTCTTTPSPASA